MSAECKYENLACLYILYLWVDSLSDKWVFVAEILASGGKRTFEKEQNISNTMKKSDTVFLRRMLLAFSE